MVVVFAAMVVARFISTAWHQRAAVGLHHVQDRSMAGSGIDGLTALASHMRRAIWRFSAISDAVLVG